MARASPTRAIPYPWSVYRWLDGEPASHARDRRPAAASRRRSRGFLDRAARRVDADRRPGARASTTSSAAARWRTYEEETLEAIDALGDEIPRDAVMRVWEDAMSTAWDRAPVWFHGDVAAGNLLVRDGRLAAVIDFGSSGVGDPACDMVIAWTFLTGPSRDAFRAALGVDAGDLGARPRLGAVEGADHAGRTARAQPDAARRGATSSEVLADHAR